VSKSCGRLMWVGGHPLRCASSLEVDPVCSSLTSAFAEVQYAHDYKLSVKADSWPINPRRASQSAMRMMSSARTSMGDAEL